MPVITVDYPKGKFSPGQRDALAEAMTQVILQIEGGADTPAGRSIAWVKFNEIDDEIYVEVESQLVDLRNFELYQTKLPYR